MGPMSPEVARGPVQEIPLRVELTRQDSEIQRLMSFVETLSQRLEPVLANRPPNPGAERRTLGGETPGRGAVGLSPLLNTMNDHRLRIASANETLSGLLERLEV